MAAVGFATGRLRTTFHRSGDEFGGGVCGWAKGFGEHLTIGVHGGHPNLLGVGDAQRPLHAADVGVGRPGAGENRRYPDACGHAAVDEAAGWSPAPGDARHFDRGVGGAGGLGLGQVGCPTMALGCCHPGVDVTLMTLLEGQGEECALSG